MTSTDSRFRAPLVAVLLTSAVFIGGLALQHRRHAWPFSLHHGEAATQAAAALPSGAMLESTTGAATPGTHDRVPVEVEADTFQQLGIRLETVRAESLSQTLRVIATVVPDESQLSHVHTRVAGWVEQLDVNTTGQAVQAGEGLARIFSQELLSSQTEYLAARRNAATGIASVVVASGRTRLTVLGMADEEIDEIERTGEPMRLVTIVAPRSGIVLHRGISVGTAVDPSTELLTIADLSRVWVLAEVPEPDIPGVRVGTRARLEFPGSGRRAFAARADFVYPTLTERTRTLRVRLSVPNSDGALKPGLYGSAIFEPPGRRAITVSRDAVVDTGLQQHVFIAAAGGQFEPRPVTLGTRLADRVEILEGLVEGERIVSSGVFLLDSESRLRATSGAGGHAHGGAAPPVDRPVPAADTPHAGH